MDAEMGLVMSDDVLSIRVVVPHFFSDSAESGQVGYGSSRSGNRLSRSLALARCLGGILALNRAPTDLVLNILGQEISTTPASNMPGARGLKVELHLFVTGDDWIQDVISLYEGRLHLHKLSLSDPRQLPLTAVHELLTMNDPAQMSLYLEDDLVISDSLYVDKIAWLCEQTQHRFIFMPHRYEPTVGNSPQKLYVDGPNQKVDEKSLNQINDQVDFLTANTFGYTNIGFSVASNPHSGSFCLTSQQVNHLNSFPWPPNEFVGPLETAATGVFLEKYPILKPSWRCREFLQLEHASPSFLPYINKLPRSH